MTGGDGDRRSRWIEYVPLGDIQFAQRNPKGHDIDGIGGAIDLHGMGELPLIDERTGALVAGHGRIIALRDRQAQGGSPPDGLEIDGEGRWLAPVIRGWRSSSDAAAESYLIGSNQWVMAGGWEDETELLAMLEHLAETDQALLTATGYDPSGVEQLRRAVEAATEDESDGPADFPAYDDDIATDYRCPQCKYEWSGSPK